MTKRKTTSTKRSSAVSVTVKRRGHFEAFDERKVYASVYAACASAHITHPEGEKIAAKVCKELKGFMKGKSRIDVNQIFKKVIQILKKIDANAAFMYETHRDLS